MLEFGTARSGAPTVAMDGHYLHSRFDPQREAERYLDGNTDRLPPAPSCVLVVGLGLGYLIDAARKRWPKTKIVSVRLLPETGPPVVAEADRTVAVDPSAPNTDTLERALLDCLDEEDAAAPAIIRWKPVCSNFPRSSDAADVAIRNVVRQLTTSRMTVGFFGRRWIRNAFLNFLTTESVVTARGRPSSVVIVASGPSLERTLPAIADELTAASVWALPSAVPALHACGVEVDLVVVTDPGFYTIHHLRSLGETVPLAMPLTARRIKHRGPALLIDQGSFVEREIARRAPVPALPVPSNGTVAGTAQLLATRLGAGRILFLGLDMAAHDVRAHARPHGFDGLLFESSCRLRPELTVRYERVAGAIPVAEASGWRSDTALSTYASWFRRNARNSYRLSDSPVDLGMRRVTLEEAVQDIAATEAPLVLETEPVGRPSVGERLAVVRDVVRGWSRLSLELGDPDCVERVLKENRELFTAVDLPALLRYRRDPSSGVRELRRSLEGLVAGAEKFVRFDG